MKTITVTDEAYETIKELKEGDESFSKLLLRIGKPRLTAKELFGALKMSEEEVAEARSKIKKIREKASKNAEERKRRLWKNVRA